MLRRQTVERSWLVLALLAAAALATAGCAVRSASEDKRPAPSAATAEGLEPGAAHAFVSRSAGRVPARWHTETVALPVHFAPDVPFHGQEEVHSPPGFLDPSSTQFLSYAFVWHIEGAADLSKASLEDALTRYFVGLARTVSEGRYPIDTARIGATLAEIEVPADTHPTQRRLRGEIRALDPSRTGQYLTLHADVRAGSCEGSGRSQVTASISPQARTHAVWSELDNVFDAFDCAPSQHLAER